LFLPNQKWCSRRKRKLSLEQDPLLEAGVLLGGSERAEEDLIVT